MPPLNTLTALCLRPVNGRSTLYRSEQYDIGRFQAETGRRKHYDIWWCPVPEFDGF